MIIVYMYNMFYVNIETCIYHIIYIKKSKCSANISI